MNLVTGAIGSLIPKLGQLLRDEYKLQSKLRSQVELLTQELESIQAALHEVAKVPREQLSEPIKTWARQVRESSYNIEDVLDSFLVRVDSTKPANPSKLKKAIEKMTNLFSNWKARRDIVVAIEDIKKQLQIVADRRDRYKVDDMVAKPIETVDPRLVVMHKKMTELVGIGKALRDIISMLKTTKKVSIVGIGGLGKTTLAKASYDKLSLKYKYKAFVSVGQNPDLAKVFKNILFDLSKRKYENIHKTRRGVELLIRELQQFLENKRYLIVIDDVWETSTWNWIQNALVIDSNCDNRVITTTRIVDVAKTAGDVYNMEPLSDAYSKELFCTRMGVGPMDDQLASEATKKILKKCGGIPLSIITIASLLVDKQVAEWYMVYDSIGFGPEGKNQIVDDMRKILLFSYYDLPPHMKTCLLYLSIYPEDTEINREDVIWKWIGEGFVNTEDGKVLFQVADTYFTHLINKSMIQPVYNEIHGLVDGCRVHDMVLDLICILATEENFARKLEGGREDSCSSPLQSSSAACVRRLALHGGSNQGQKSNLQATDVARVRSINAFSCPITSRIPQLSKFHVLRVLSLENCGHGCDLKHLGKLIHLRYLGLCGTHVDELPRDISNLVHLQSLDVLDTGLRKLPSTIDELSNLMRLRLDIETEVRPSLDIETEVRPSLGKLTSLQDLQSGMRWSGMPVELGKLTELRILMIYFQELGDEDVKSLEDSLHCLHKIEELQVILYDKPVLIGVGPFSWKPSRQIQMLWLQNIHLPRLPSWLNPKHTPHLHRLFLELRVFEPQDMDILGSLPELRELELWVHMGRIVSWTFPGGKLFPKLMTMDLRGIHVENVRLLEIKNIRVTEKDIGESDEEEEDDDHNDDEEEEDDDHDDGEVETSARDQEDEEEEDDDHDDEEEATLDRDQELQKHEEEKDACDGVAKLSS